MVSDAGRWRVARRENSPMKKYVVLSALGKDRPGLVNRITHAIKDAGGNIEIQRSTRMAGEYALIVLVTLDDAGGKLDETIRRLGALGGPDLMISARPAISPGGEPETAGMAELEASGADQPGLIDAVTLLLYRHHINIESMNYDTESAPMTGEHLFRMNARLAIPKGLDVAALREQLRDMERAYNFDVILRHPVD
jgi:glycine cleavage system regulatory protein